MFYDSSSWDACAIAHYKLHTLMICNHCRRCWHTLRMIHIRPTSRLILLSLTVVYTNVNNSITLRTFRCTIIITPSTNTFHRKINAAVVFQAVQMQWSTWIHQVSFVGQHLQVLGNASYVLNFMKECF